MNGFALRHQGSVLTFVIVLLLIAVSNLFALRKLGSYPLPARFPRVSVLVPARDEEVNIGPCIASLLGQVYPDFEVLALDDGSTDQTMQVLAALAAQDTRLEVLQGKPLPPDWLGKHWACQQLAEAADGELLLFVDADTRHEPYALRDAVAALEAEHTDLLSVLPREEVVSWAERLVVPVMTWSIFSFLPLALAYRVSAPWLSATVGQFMFFRRRAYEQIGGHAAVRHDVVDDLALGRRIKAQGLRWRLLDGKKHICCRMYHNLSEVLEGFGKSLFAAFTYNVPLFVFIWLWLVVVFWEPLVVLLLALSSYPLSSANLALAIGAVMVSLLLWGISYWRFGFALYLTLLYPLTMLLTVAIALRSIMLTLLGRATWKGRRLAPTKS